MTSVPRLLSISPFSFYPTEWFSTLRSTLASPPRSRVALAKSYPLKGFTFLICKMKRFGWEFSEVAASSDTLSLLNLFHVKDFNSCLSCSGVIPEAYESHTYRPLSLRAEVLCWSHSPVQLLELIKQLWPSMLLEPTKRKNMPLRCSWVSNRQERLMRVLRHCWSSGKFGKLFVGLCAHHFTFLGLDFLICTKKQWIRSEVFYLAAHEEL